MYTCNQRGNSKVYRCRLQVAEQTIGGKLHKLAKFRAFTIPDGISLENAIYYVRNVILSDSNSENMNKALDNIMLKHWIDQNKRKENQRKTTRKEYN